MKKKILITLLLLVCVLACAFGLTACDSGNSHSHDYVQKYDEIYHWQECTNYGCNAKTKGRAAHTFGANNRCTVCGYEKGAGGNEPITPEKPDDECKHIYDKYEPIDEYYHMVFCSRCGNEKKEMHQFGEDGNDNICIYCDYHKKDTPNIPDIPDVPDVPDTPDSVEYTLNSDGESYSISKTSAFNETELIIPSQYNGKPVTTIGYSGFSNCDSLTSVIIPNSVTSIRDYAFSYCSSLKSITIPDSVTSIGFNVFSTCGALERINYTGNIASWCGVDNSLYGLISKVYIGNQKLQNITGELIIPNNVTRIGNCAFYGCSSLTSITIPDSVTSIGSYAFEGCSALEKVSVNENNAYYASQDGILYNKTKTEFIHIPKAITGELTVPENVTGINGYMFSGCSGITKINVSVGNIKYHSEGNCLIETVSKTLILGCKNSKIPADGSVTSIGSYAFSGCNGLTSITIPSNITYVGREAFSMCENLNTVYWNAIDCETEWADIQGEDARGIFYETDIATVIVGNGVTNIREYTFYGCSSLTSISIPDSVTNIGEFAFYDCNNNSKSITFNGTIEQWNAIEKWDSGIGNTGKYTIHCTDGDIAKGN